MKRTKRTKRTNMIVILLALALMSIVTGCENEVYNPNGKTENLPPIGEYFDFNLRGSVQLTVNYNAPGFKTLIEIYGQDPMQEDGKTKKEGIKPMYAAYTDENGKFAGKINVSTALKEAYLYTDRWGLPVCVKLGVSADGLTYDATAKQPVTKSAATRAPYEYVIGDKQPYTLANRTSVDKLYALGRFDIGGYLYWTTVGENSDYTPNYLTQTLAVKEDPIADLLARTQAFFKQYDGRRFNLLKPANVTNTKVTKEGTLDVVYLAEMGAYKNSFGYYYYEEGEAPKTEVEFKAMKKYLIVPFVQTTENSSTTIVKPGDTVRLKYFGKDGNAEATEVFPKGTVVGWFLASDGWNSGSGTIRKWNKNNSYERIFFFSNDEGNHRRFVAIKDAKTGVVVLGCEDRTVKELEGNEKDEDYSDVLFFVKSEDAELDNSDKPEIVDPTPPLSDGSFSVAGTLAFEDVWPNGDDYDLNDVIIEYSRKIVFDSKNMVKKITETFTPVHDAKSAKQDNYFACQYKTLGTVASYPEGVSFESETNSLVITNSQLSVSGKSYTIERDMVGTNLSVQSNDGKQTISDGFNPYIITKLYTKSDRIEIHLPKHEMTSAADKGKMNANNAYYVSADGIYPFAIDIPIVGFKAVAEKKNIGVEYPSFIKWAESKGAQDTDWYNNYQGPKK